MDIKKYELDQNAVDGKWFEYDGARFKIAYYSRPDFNRVAWRVGKRYNKNAIEADPALSLVQTIEVMSEAVLLDWEGVTEGGQPIPCTKANRILLLNIAPFRDWVTSISSELQNFQAEADAEDATQLKSGPGVGAAVGEG